MIDKRVGKENINYLQNILTCSKQNSFTPSLWSSMKYLLFLGAAGPQLTHSSQHLLAHKKQKQKPSRFPSSHQWPPLASPEDSLSWSQRCVTLPCHWLKRSPPISVNVCQKQGMSRFCFGEDTVDGTLVGGQTWVKAVEMHIQDILSNSAGAGEPCRMAGRVLRRLDPPPPQAGPGLGPHACPPVWSRGRPRR